MNRRTALLGAGMLALSLCSGATQQSTVGNLGCLRERRRRSRFPTVPRRLAEAKSEFAMDLPFAAREQEGGSCTGFACALAIAMVTGLDPSPLDLYQMGRKRCDRFPGDAGAYVNEVLAAANELGFLLETERPFRYEDLNKQRSLQERSRAIGRRGILFYPIDIGEIVATLSAETPVVLGIDVDYEINGVVGMEPVELLGEIRGGHAFVIYGYDSIGVYCRSSWGCDFGLDGSCRISWGALERGRPDLTAVTTG